MRVNQLDADRCLQEHHGPARELDLGDSLHEVQHPGRDPGTRPRARARGSAQRAADSLVTVATCRPGREPRSPAGRSFATDKTSATKITAATLQADRFAAGTTAMPPRQ